mmetsp:Transcript_9371/g.24228  ORF Transcript_9371/g.24228 Transcript_9371/m.24228 type:complete len:303 (-) Transcript_9371:1411-2319(-)
MPSESEAQCPIHRKLDLDGSGRPIASAQRIDPEPNHDLAAIDTARTVAVTVCKGVRRKQDRNVGTLAGRKKRAARKSCEPAHWLAQLSDRLRDICLHDGRPRALSARVEHLTAHADPLIRSLRTGRVDTRATEPEGCKRMPVTKRPARRSMAVEVPPTGAGIRESPCVVSRRRSVVLAERAPRGLVVVVQRDLSGVAREGEGQAASWLRCTEQHIGKPATAFRPRVARPHHRGACIDRRGQHERAARDDDENDAPGGLRANEAVEQRHLLGGQMRRGQAVRLAGDFWAFTEHRDRHVRTRER